MVKALLLVSSVSLFFSCAGLKNPVRQLPAASLPDGGTGRFFTVSDGTEIYIYEYINEPGYESTVYLLSGITGINHLSEHDVVSMLASVPGGCRVVVIHPRGTGCSGGKRGDTADFNKFINDHIEIIDDDMSNHPGSAFFLFGHSMSAALAAEVMNRISCCSDGNVKLNGIILVNPPYLMKKSDGMSPRLADYIKYSFYFIFAPHVPVVDMGGNPEQIENAEERAEAEARRSDPLIIKYFSLSMMMRSSKMMNNMKSNAEKAECPLLLIYGTADSLVERTGCEVIFSSWKNDDKTFIEVPGGPHGKITVLMADDEISQWIMKKNINPDM